MAILEVQVGVSADDGYAYSTTFMGDYSQLRMGSSGNLAIRAFARFTGVIIPADAIIGVCYVSFFVWNTTQPGVYLKVKADDLANPDAPTDATEVFAITPTTVGVDWDDQPDVDDWANTPNIQSVIAELQASYDYSAGAAITIIIDNDGSGINEILYARSWDYSDQLYPPKLHIEYTIEAPAYYHGLKVQSEGELALCDVESQPLRIRKGGTTYGLELVAVDDPNASRIRVKTSAGTKAIRKYT